MIKSSLLLIMFSAPLFSNEIYDVPIQEFRDSIIQENNFDRIIAPNSFYFSAPGRPELPAVTYSYLLPAGQELKQVEVLSAEWEELPENYYIYPKQTEIALEKEHQFTVPDPEIYGSTDLYPQEIIVRSFSGKLRGYHIGQAAIAPFRYIPGTRKLYLLKSLRIKIETEPGTMGMFPKRQTKRAKSIVEIGRAHV